MADAGTSSLTALRRYGSAATDYIERNRSALVTLLSELIQFRSVFPPGDYEAIARRMQAEFGRAGLRTALVTAPAVDIEPRGLSYPRENVVAALDGAGGGPVLLIATHMDVVEAGDDDQWTHPPFDGAVADNRVWGRGACDAKNALAAQVFAARALVACGAPMRGTLLLVSSVDDEGRFDRLKWPGMTYLAERGLREHGFPMPDMVINGEASGLGSICGSFKGRLIMEIPVRGETAHAATPFGINAIHQAVKLVNALRQIELESHPLLGDETLNICAIRGTADRYGDIPPICKVGLEIRVVPPFGTARILGEINRTIARLAAEDPQFSVGDFSIFSNRQPIEFTGTSPLVVAIREAASFVGVEAAFAGILGSGELQVFVAQGIPGVTYGGGSIARVHKPNEYIDIDDLVRQTQIYALTALALCGAPETEPV